MTDEERAFRIAFGATLGAAWALVLIVGGLSMLFMAYSWAVSTPGVRQIALLVAVTLAISLLAALLLRALRR